MRKLLLLILTLFIANMAVMAGRVSEAEALQKAQASRYFTPTATTGLLRIQCRKRWWFRYRCRR